MRKEEFGSSDAAAKGGKARAEKLTPEQRREIARRGGEAKAIKAGTLKVVPNATHEGVLEIGGTEVVCAVLNDGRRILTQGTFYKALGRSRTPKAGTGVMATVDGTPFFLQAEILKPFITQELLASTAPVFFNAKSGRRMAGYDAQLLPMVAEVYLQMRDSFLQEGKTVPKQYQHIVMACDLLTRGLARVGIIALIDEATGYQYDRPRRDLEEHLKEFLSESLRRWVQTFPGDYFKHLCRLRHVELRPDMKLPQYFGHLTNNLIYRRIAPGLLKGLKERREERGKPSDKLHPWLSEDRGFREILVHLGLVIGLMKTNTEYEKFEKQLDQVAPIFADVPGLFDDPDKWGADEDSH